MTRSRRRRGGAARRPVRPDGAGAAEAPPKQAAPAQGQAAGGAGADGAKRSPRKRRRRPGGKPAELSVLDQMATKKPKTLQTLPGEGLVLEEVIGNMREEYGYPTTPQEYRLIVRVAAEEPRGQTVTRPRRTLTTAPDRPAAASPPAEGDDRAAPGAPGSSPAAPARRGRLRRRRRGRGKGPGEAGGSAPAGPEQAGGGPDDAFPQQLP